MTDCKILIVSYLFPPVGGIGVQRALSMARYLPACGFEVHVLKATNAAGPVHDPELVRQIPVDVRVHGAFTPEVPFAIRQKLWSRLSGNSKPGRPREEGLVSPPAGFSWKRLLTRSIRRILCPEPEILWVPFAVRKARQIIRRHGIQVVLVTVPPFSALLVGTALKRDFPGLKLVSDFRDEWLSFYLKDFEFQNSEHTRRRAEAIERETVERSDLVIAVNQSSRDVIRRRYPEQPERKFAVVSNGYDPKVFEHFHPRKHQFPRMVLTHVGTVYKTASPRFLLDAIEQLPEEVRAQVEVRFVGRIADSERPMLERANCNVTILGFMPQAEALKSMEKTDYLLLTMTNDISVPGKLFEYMASGKPILAVTTPGGEVDRILRETGAGVSAPPSAPGAIRKMLEQAFAAWRAGAGPAKTELDRIRRYERPQLISQYAGMIREMVEPARATKTVV